jgi:peptidyl-dipeptidase Dcp
MKRNLFLLGLLLFITTSCKEKKAANEGNPFFTEWDTPFHVPPFDQIKTSHFEPAIREGIARHMKEMEAIIQNPATPDFQNTLEALDYSGEMLRRVLRVFYNLSSSETSKELQEVAREMAPLIAKHQDDIYLNQDLFRRIKTVYDERKKLSLDPEQDRLLAETVKQFLRGGAGLSPKDQARLREVNMELSVLQLQFDDNLLAQTNAFKMEIDNEKDLEGLPQPVISAAAETALAAGEEGNWIFTLQKPSLIPFLQYSNNRSLREKLFRAYIQRCSHGDRFDNNEILAKIASLRSKKAQLLGYKTYADFALEENMAKNPANVYQFLDRLWDPALKRAKMEAADLQAIIDKGKEGFSLEPWDWWYYSEKVRREKYNLDEEMIRPYFKLENVLYGAFEVANRLWGVTFLPVDTIPRYQKDVEVYEMKDADGSVLGILYMDFFPRETKQGGAWENEYQGEYRKGDQKIIPVVTTNFNFSQPVGNKPALLSFEEVITLFHEFGHALHSLFSDCRYPSLAGANGAIDFAELPSQIMENWAAHPEVLKMYAHHYETGEPMPDDLIEKITRSALFNQGFSSVEYISASYLDMDWHTITDTVLLNATEFEKKSMDRIGMMKEIVVRYKSPYFSHVFAGGYEAGYYSYLWSEWLDADAFQAFIEHGLFDRETARRFRENILSKGNTMDPMDMYLRFRGKEPSLTYLLKEKGLI